jgi:tRNA dimethylallyltransferase
MDIGTAKPDAETLQCAPHRLIDICDPSETYSAADFCHDVYREIEEILANGNRPLLVGGTMLYFRALQQGLSALPAADAQIRDRITKEAEKVGWQVMHDKLKAVDPESAERIHPNDPQRLQRALEVFYVTGKPLSDLRGMQEEPPFNFINLALMPEDRTLLHKQIEVRFDQMLSLGFTDEVRRLKARGDLHLDLPSMRCVGYRQAWQYLEGELSEDEMRERAIIATRQLAKRQITWLRSWPDLHVLPSPNSEEAERFLTRVF